MDLPGVEFLGKLTFDPDDPDYPPGTYVVQRVAPGVGNVMADPARHLQVRRWVIPRDPQTAAQLYRRDLMRQAVAMWHVLSEEEQHAFEADASARGISRFNAFISAYLLLQGPPRPP
jgi:hypothetical protein